MRDPERITRILALLAVYWVTHPDLRLGQIVGNAAPGDPYYFEDDDLEAWLRKQIKVT